MLVGIYGLTDANGRYASCLKAYEKILSHNNIPFVRLSAGQPDFWENVASLDLFIFRWGVYDSHTQLARDILPVIDKELGIRCFPDVKTCWHYEDKVKQTLLMKAHGFPMVDTHVFWQKKEALEWIDQAKMPVVFKLRAGAGSKNVLLLSSRGQARRLVRRLFGKGIRPDRMFSIHGLRISQFSLYRELHQLAGNLYRWAKGLNVADHWQVEKDYAMFQKFLPGNDSDTRITVIGDRAFAFRRMVRRNDFRASGSGMIDYDMNKIDLRCVEIALKVSKKLNFQSMAYDFLFTEDKQPQFCEISHTYKSDAVYECPGYWDARLNWHAGHFWPEHLHLIDALNLPHLKSPFSITESCRAAA